MHAFSASLDSVWIDDLASFMSKQKKKIQKNILKQPYGEITVRSSYQLLANGQWSTLKFYIFRTPKISKVPKRPQKSWFKFLYSVTLFIQPKILKTNIKIHVFFFLLYRQIIYIYMHKQNFMAEKMLKHVLVVGNNRIH